MLAGPPKKRIDVRQPGAVIPGAGGTSIGIEADTGRAGHRSFADRTRVSHMTGGF
jgi:hypothetical protein